MFAPVRITKPSHGLRLQPLQQSTVNIPAFDNKIYINPALQHVDLQSRKLSEIPTQRSRVFARQENRFLPDVQKAAPPAGQASQPRQPSQGVKTIVRLGQRTNHQDKLFLASRPAGKSTVSHQPSVPRSIPTGANSPSKHQSRLQNDSKTIVSQVAGVSSKEHESYVSRTDKMASGWAEARVGHAIPNLRDSLEQRKTPAKTSKDNDESNTKSAQATTDQVHGANRKQPVQSDNQEVRKSDTPKVTEEKAKYKAKVEVENKTRHTKLSSRQSKASNTKSKESSGYGSISSNSQNGQTTADNKYSVFKTLTHTESLPSSEKTKALSSVYKSKVKVEQTHSKVGHHPAADQETVLSEREAGMYIHLKSTYQKAAEQERERRKANFFKKLQNIQIDSALRHNREVQNRMARKELSKKRQVEQLAQIRNKFEEDRQKRYKSQYVTKNFLNYERMNRGEYGLPENFTTKTQHRAKLRPGGEKVTALEFLKREVKLKKNYSKMFAQSATKKPISSDPKMEGKDQITLEVFDDDGNPVKGKRIDVKTELKEAEAMLKVIETTDDNPVQTSSTGKPEKSQKFSTSKNSKVSTKPTAPTRVEPAANRSLSVKKPIIPTEVVPQDNTSTQVIASQSNYQSLDVSKPALDTLSVTSRISAITEESEAGDDFYDKLMAKYGIELSDDDD